MTLGNDSKRLKLTQQQQQGQGQQGNEENNVNQGNTSNLLSSVNPLLVNPNEHPFDQDGFFYFPCEKDPILSSLYREESPISGGNKTLDHHHQNSSLSCNYYYYSGVHLSAEHSSKFLALDRGERRRLFSTEKKYRTIMGNLGISAGQALSGDNHKRKSFYFEVESVSNNVVNNNVTGVVRNGPSPVPNTNVVISSTGHVRVGVAEYSATLQAPVGYDQFGYGFRDLDGSPIHRSVRLASFSNADSLTDYVPFNQPGSVVGILVEFNRNENRNESGVKSNDELLSSSSCSLLTRNRRSPDHRIPIKFKGSIFFEEKDPFHSNTATMKRSPIPNCQVDWLKLEDSGSTAHAASTGTSATIPSMASSSSGKSLLERQREAFEKIPLLRFSSSTNANINRNDYFGTIKISLFVNGRQILPQGVIEIPLTPENIHAKLYPAISAHGNITLDFNPGPNFKYPPASLSSDDDDSGSVLPWALHHDHSEIENLLLDIVEQMEIDSASNASNVNASNGKSKKNKSNL